MAALPTLFVSHGAPTLPLEPSPARDFLAGLGTAVEREWRRPAAILCVSAHWETQRPAVASGDSPATVHDFYGFPEALYRMRYPAPGAPALAAAVAARLAAAGLACDLDPARGLDHGAWVPLLLMWPAADIPVAQLAVQPALGPRHHLAMGRALAPLRAEGVLVLGSGGAVHNVADAMRHRRAGDTAAPPPVWASRFAAWLADAAGDPEALAAFRQAPGAALAQPSDEHFLPILVAAGAAGADARARRLFDGFSYGSLSMAAYAFAEDQEGESPYGVTT